MILAQEILKFLECDPLTKGLHPTHFGINNKTTGRCDRPKGIGTHILILCIGGKGFIKSNSASATLEAQDLLLVPANCPHSYGAVNGHHWDIYWTHFAGNQALDFIKPFTEVSIIHYGEVIFNKALTIYRDYHNCLSKNLTRTNLIVASQILRHLLSYLFYLRSANDPSEFARLGIEKAIELMKSNLHRPLSLANIASEVGFSKSHFLYLFKKETGFSPIDYFNNMKIRYACEQLVSSDLSIAAVSAVIGINNQHYFSRLFSKIMGVSPREYRKQNAWML